MQISHILRKSLDFQQINLNEALYLYNNASISELMVYANILRKKIHNNKNVSYIVDRNINYTNVCFSKCIFCNFYRNSNSNDSYILTIEELYKKIDELYKAGGNQILLQGGMNPKLNLHYFTKMFKDLKSKYPNLRLHALSPSEIIFLSKKEKKTINYIISELKDSGLDSLPGGGAEILSDRVRKIISPLKCSVNEWLLVMKTAHELNITTSATMMFGHLETIEERIKHLILLRNLQEKKPHNSTGFISFTVWPLAGSNTILERKHPEIQPVHSDEYIKMLALSRLILNNIPNIQASWLTVGTDIAGVCLFSGANDLSSIMIEENVLSSADKNNKLDEKSMRELIESHGFIPVKRNQEYQIVD